MNDSASYWIRLGVSAASSVLALAYCHWLLARLSAPSTTPPFMIWLWRCMTSPLASSTSTETRPLKVIDVTARSVCRVRMLDMNAWVCETCSDIFDDATRALDHVTASRVIGE